MSLRRGVDGLRYLDIPPARDKEQEKYRIDLDGNRIKIEEEQEDDKVSYGYGSRNRRIQQEAGLVAARTLAVQAQAEGFRQHTNEQLKRINEPHDLSKHDTDMYQVLLPNGTREWRRHKPKDW